jgi:hypothetical protein
MQTTAAEKSAKMKQPAKLWSTPKNFGSIKNNCFFSSNSSVHLFIVFQQNMGVKTELLIVMIS